jgi:bifunctional oligoribonuclease and PAP phosphatase NrnA
MVEVEVMQSFTETLESAKNIVIINHRKPDGDAMGACLGLYHYLKKKYDNNVILITPTDYPEFLWWLPGNDTVLNFETNAKKATTLIGKADLVFCVDFNKPKRAEELGELILASKAAKVLVDHHPDPDPVFDFSFHDVEATSSSEIVYDLIKKLGDENYMDKDVATCIYTGLMTDTDNFRIPNTTSKSHTIAADLIDRGVDNAAIYSNVYETFSESRLRFFGYCIEKMEYLSDLKTGIIAIEREDIYKFHIKTGDTEGLVNYPMKIKDTRLAVLIAQRPEEVKLSFRSKGNLDVNEFAKTYFNGGGHKNAAGGSSGVSVAETKKYLIDLLYKNKYIFND